MKYLPLFLVAVVAILSGCADKDKKGDAAAFGDSTDDIYDQALPERSGNPDNADYETLKSETVYFAYDSFTIEAKERPKLDKLANYLNTESSYTTEPDWSPDGKLIAYSISSGGGQIGVYDVSAKKARIVSRGSGLESPSWTRNSRHLVASQNGHLVLLDTLTGETIKIPNNLSNNTEPNTSR